ncbi:MAG: hypothetical protein M3O31_00085 [Acidobacteriota bacterium]|nr:hypothetical protein [Acidobacteriota bacterium]
MFAPFGIPCFSGVIDAISNLMYCGAAEFLLLLCAATVSVANSVAAISSNKADEYNAENFPSVRIIISAPKCQCRAMSTEWKPWRTKNGIVGKDTGDEGRSGDFTAKVTLQAVR